MNQTFHVNNKSIYENHQYMTIHTENSINNANDSGFKHLKTCNTISTYQTPTSSSLIKRSKTVNRKAYISVFG